MNNPSAECQQKSQEKNTPISSTEIQQLDDSIDKASHLDASDTTAAQRNP